MFVNDASVGDEGLRVDGVGGEGPGDGVFESVGDGGAEDDTIESVGGEGPGDGLGAESVGGEGPGDASTAHK